MLKKTIKYTNYVGDEVTKEFHFNLTQPELIKMETSVEGGLSTSLKTIVATGKGSEIINFVENLIFKSYGEISTDGDRFEKSEAKSIAFSQTPAYEVLFEELTMNENALADFVNGIIPASLREKINK